MPSARLRPADQDIAPSGRDRAALTRPHPASPVQSARPALHCSLALPSRVARSKTALLATPSRGLNAGLTMLDTASGTRLLWHKWGVAGRGVRAQRGPPAATRGVSERHGVERREPAGEGEAAASCRVGIRKGSTARVHCGCCDGPIGSEPASDRYPSQQPRARRGLAEGAIGVEHPGIKNQTRSASRACGPPLGS